MTAATTGGAKGVFHITNGILLLVIVITLIVLLGFAATTVVILGEIIH